MVMDESKIPVNVLDSMLINLESGANRTDTSGLQNEKHSEPRTWTFRGIVIDMREE
jgi:hypothetical protein